LIISVFFKRTYFPGTSQTLDSNRNLRVPKNYTFLTLCKSQAPVVYFLLQFVLSRTLFYKYLAVPLVPRSSLYSASLPRFFTSSLDEKPYPSSGVLLCTILRLKSVPKIHLLYSLSSCLVFTFAAYLITHLFSSSPQRHNLLTSLTNSSFLHNL
jgi:hypothetical protein